MERKIGMIGGTGPQGQGLALRWGLAGESVIMGSRQQEKADRISAEVNTKLGNDLVIPRVNEKCVEEADIVLLTVPFDYAVSTLTPLLKHFTPDKILVDVTVPLKPFEKGKLVDVLPELEQEAKSATELLRKITPSDIPVVGAFKTLSNTTLQDTDRLPTLNQDVFVFSKDREAKHVVKEIAALIKNLRPVDSGGTLAARHVERFTAFLIGLNRRYKTHDSGFYVSGLPSRDW
jgi:NADPH-dependent F420 reductase